MPAEPTFDHVKDVVVEFVDRPTRRGRPVRLTPRAFLRICHLVEKGFAITRACEVECISYGHFRLRVSRSERLQARLKKAEETRFNRRHEEALEAIMAAGEKSWMAYAWLLERTMPQLYALRSVHRDANDDQQGEPEIPSEILARHRALLLELAREDEAKRAASQVPELPGPQAA
jgi:hypothetical protein